MEEKNNPILEGEDIIQKEAQERNVSGGEIVLTSIVIGIIVFCVGFGISLIRDKSVQVFLCPTSQEFDAPVSLVKINNMNEKEAEMYIRGFVRQIIRAFYPKNSEEVEHLFKFASEHTLGDLQYLYKSYYKDRLKIGALLDDGLWVDFFPAGPISKEESVRIIKQGQGEWVVEIEGFLNDKKSALEDDRGVITLRLEIVKGESLLGGSKSGLYVKKREYIYSANPMVNNKEVINQ